MTQTTETMTLNGREFRRSEGTYQWIEMSAAEALAARASLQEALDLDASALGAPEGDDELFDDPCPDCGWEHDGACPEDDRSEP